MKVKSFPIARLWREHMISTIDLSFINLHATHTFISHIVACTIYAVVKLLLRVWFTAALKSLKEGSKPCDM